MTSTYQGPADRMVPLLLLALLVLASASGVPPARAQVVKATVTVGMTPYGVAYDSGKGEVFVANRDSYSVSVISDSTNSVVSTVSVPIEPSEFTLYILQAALQELPRSV